MRLKQQVHSGNRVDDDLQALDALVPTLTYAGWQDDVAEAEKTLVGSFPNLFKVNTRETGTKMRRGTEAETWRYWHARGGAGSGGLAEEEEEEEAEEEFFVYNRSLRDCRGNQSARS